MKKENLLINQIKKLVKFDIIAIILLFVLPKVYTLFGVLNNDFLELTLSASWIILSIIFIFKYLTHLYLKSKILNYWKYPKDYIKYNKVFTYYFSYFTLFMIIAMIWTTTISLITAVFNINLDIIILSQLTFVLQWTLDELSLIFEICFTLLLVFDIAFIIFHKKIFN